MLLGEDANAWASFSVVCVVRNIELSERLVANRLVQDKDYQIGLIGNIVIVVVLLAIGVEREVEIGVIVYSIVHHHTFTVVLRNDIRGYGSHPRTFLFQGLRACYKYLQFVHHANAR
jgi:hypothetical protein